VTKTIRIPDEEYDKIRQYADKRDIPMSAALSQYLNVVEEFRTQLHRGPPDDGQAQGVPEVDDWEEPEEIDSQQDNQREPAEPDHGTDLASLQQRVEVLETELDDLQETVQTLHFEEHIEETHQENE
jgi:hypothetical protein